MQIRVFFLFLLLVGVVVGQTPKITPEEYIATYRQVAIDHMKKFHIPASIILAQGILESANGNSRLAREANNHFGIKCHTDWQGDTFYQDDDTKNECFRKYATASESFVEHGVFLSTRKRYASLFELSSDDYKGWAYGLKQAGYATNPKYPELLISLIERYQLNAYDKGGVPRLAKHKEEGKAKKMKHKTVPEVEGMLVSMGGRTITEKNGIPCVYAKLGDNPKQIALALDLMPWQIYKYNDLSKTDTLIENQVIYIKPKHRKASVETHVVAEGETLQAISQAYGVKLKQVKKKNNLTTNTIRVGQSLKLR